MVTNKPTEFTLPLLQRTGLAGFFDAVVCGDTCARRKPDPDQVQHACDLLGVAVNEAVTIGDSSTTPRPGAAPARRSWWCLMATTKEGTCASWMSMV